VWDGVTRQEFDPPRVNPPEARRPEYEATLMGLDASSTVDFEETVSKLRKAEARLKGQGITMHGQNLARQTFQQGKKGSDKLHFDSGHRFRFQIDVRSDKLRTYIYYCPSTTNYIMPLVNTFF
jgi:hypothetical protein